MNAIQADAICRLREEAYRIARWAEPDYADLCARWGLQEQGEPKRDDLISIRHLTRRWLAWDAPAVMGDDAAEFSAAVRALDRDARAVLRWIEETEASRPASAP